MGIHLPMKETFNLLSSHIFLCRSIRYALILFDTLLYQAPSGIGNNRYYSVILASSVRAPEETRPLIDKRLIGQMDNPDGRKKKDEQPARQQSDGMDCSTTDLSILLSCKLSYRSINLCPSH